MGKKGEIRVQQDVGGFDLIGASNPQYDPAVLGPFGIAAAGKILGNKEAENEGRAEAGLRSVHAPEL